MEYICKDIETELGIIYGRDGIFVDSFEQAGNSLIIQGIVNGHLCRGKELEQENYKVKIIFKGLQVYTSQMLDIYPWKKWNTSSQFNEVINSDWIGKYGLPENRYRHFVLETYDWVYIVLCESYEFLILKK